MLLSDFDFDLPEELIAQDPIEPRDQARLLVYTRATDTISHHKVADLPRLLPDQTLLIGNNSKVRHGRLYTTEGREILLVGKEGDYYRALIRGKEPKINQRFQIQHDKHPLPFYVTVTSVEIGPGMTTLLLNLEGEEENEILIEKYGKVPLPPYIHASHAPAERYQTIYAGPLGSAAAPTAGLHFTEDVFKNLTAAGHRWETVTLHVGLGTFLPLRNEEVTANHLHTEITEVTSQVATDITTQIKEHKPLLAVGTTSLRTLESHWQDGQVIPGTLATNLFLYPGLPIHTATILFTNFHLPKSSLLLLVAAFLSMNSTREQRQLSYGEIVAVLHRIYGAAITEKYRFFSFGDAMLIL